jgi:hypothetical protein
MDKFFRRTRKDFCAAKRNSAGSTRAGNDG